MSHERFTKCPRYRGKEDHHSQRQSPQKREHFGFEESEHWYDHLENHIGWKSLGKVLCGWVTQPGDIEGKPELQRSYELGRSIK